MAANTFRFTGFSEKISKIKIDIHHKIGEVRELSETTDETYFKESLLKWRDLNCSKDFSVFRAEIWDKIQDLRQIIYHQEDIIKILCKHLLVKNSQCLDALLDLVAQIAKDLRNEFYQHFEGVFDVITKLLVIHDAEALEQTFTCMAYIFKYCWRYMIQDYQKVYSMYKKLLSTSQKIHIRQFAAESISFLIRKLKDKDSFLDVVFASALDDHSLTEGIGCLLFQTIKGVSAMFHSCTKDVLEIMLQKLEVNHAVFECLSVMFKAAAKYTTQEHVHVLWQCLLSETMSTKESVLACLESSTASVKLNYLLKLLNILVQWKSGVLLFNVWDEVLEAVECLLKPEPVTSIADDYLELLQSLLHANIPLLKTEQMQRIVQQMFSTGFEVEKIKQFMCSVRQFSSFQSIVLASFYKYAEAGLLMEEVFSSNRAGILLELLSKNVIETTDLFRIPSSPGPIEERHLVSFHGQRRRQESADNSRMMADRMLQVMENCSGGKSETFDDMRLMNIAHSCVVCVPFLRPLDSNKVLRCLVESLNNWIQRIVVDGFQASSMLLFLISQTVQAICLILSDETEIKSIGLEHKTMFSLVSRFPTNILVLTAYDCYCKMLFSQSTDHSLSTESFEQVYPLLKYNLSSIFPITRLLTLRILQYFKQSLTVSSLDEHADSRPLAISTCLTAEEVPVTFGRYLEKLMHLRKLTFSVVENSPGKQFHNDVIVRVLVGNLFVNLRPMWEPVMEILQTFATEQNANDFWDVFSGQLKSAFADSAEEEGTNTADSNIHNESDGIEFVKGRGGLVHLEFFNEVEKSTLCLLLCQSMEKFPAIAERKSRDVLPIFFKFLSKEYGKFDSTFVAHQNILKSKDQPMVVDAEGEDELEHANESESSSKPSKRLHQKKKILVSFLKLLASFKNPKALYMEVKLHELYLQLLSHHDNEIQALAFDCLKTYRFGYLKPYEDNFGKLLQDNTFKDELTLFSDEKETGIVKPEHRTEIAIWKVTTTFWSRNNAKEEIQPSLEKMIPLRKQIGFLNMLKTILTRLGGSVKKHVMELFRILLELLHISSSCLEQRANINSFSVGQLKSIRQTGLARLVDFLEAYTDMDFTCFSEQIFKYSVLPQKKSSEVVQLVMSVVENILQPKETGEANFDSERIILKYLDLIFTYLSEVIKSPKSSNTANSHKCSAGYKLELNILAKISSFVREPEQCQAVINILFPTLKTTRDEQAQINTLKTVKTLLLNNSTAEISLNSLTTLFLTMKDKLARVLLCDVYEIMAQRDEELSPIKGLVHDMNSWNPRRLDEPDFDRRLQAFADFSEMLQQGSASSKHIKPLLCNCIHYSLESSDISLRDASLSCISRVIDFVSTRREFFDELIQGILISRIKVAIRSKSEIVRSEYIQILSKIVNNFDECVISDMKSLTSTDAELDFFENVRHIQVHRRIKAMRTLSQHIEEGELRLNSLFNFLLPMISHFIFEHASAGEHNIVSETITTIGCIAGRLTWQKYCHVLKSYLRLLAKEKTRQKTILRIVVAILNAFPFDLSVLNDQSATKLSEVSESVKETVSADTGVNEMKERCMGVQSSDVKKDVDMKDVQSTKSEINNEDDEDNDDAQMDENDLTATDAVDTENNDIVLARKIHKSISSSILPLLHSSLTQKSFVEDFHRKSHNKEVDQEEILRVPLALAMVKLLQQLPKSTLHEFLPGLLLRVCQSLKSRARDVRETARTTLVKIAASLGPSYLPYIVREMRSVLKRGYQLHVLSYTLKAILDGLIEQFSPGDLDECLNDILNVLMNDIFSNLAEEKESEGIKENLHEAKSKQQSYESFEIISKFVSAGSFEEVINVVRKLLETEHTHTVRNKAKEVLRRISLGFQKNASLSQRDLLVFIYRTLVDSKPLLNDNEKKNIYSTDKGPAMEDIFLIKSEPGRNLLTAHRDKSASSHLLTEFALQVLFSLLKQSRQKTPTQDDLELLDPFVETLVRCLKSKYNQVVHLGTKSLSLLVQLPLPAILMNVDLLSKSVFQLLQKYGRIKTGTDENRELVGSAFKAMTVLLRNGNKCKITDDQLKILLMFVEEDIYDHSRQGTAFPLLKAILSRKLNVPEMSDVIEKIGDLSITSSTPSVQLQCRQIMLQYLLDYPLGKKSEKYLEFYINQLEYEWETGRQSALEMIALIFKHFPPNRLQEYAVLFFVPLAMRLINDDSALCRKLTLAVISTLLEKLQTGFRTELFRLVLKWLEQDKAALKRLSTQILGTFAEVEKTAFEKRLSDLLPFIKDGLTLDSDVMEEDDASDQLIFFTLNTVSKIFQNSKQYEIRRFKMNSTIYGEYLNNCVIHFSAAIEELLGHPHTWIRLASCQLFGQLFATWTTAEVMKISQTDASKCIYLSKDLPSKITKNVIYLSKIINISEHDRMSNGNVQDKDVDGLEEQKSNNLSLKWLLHKMSYLASHEASQSQNTSIKRTCVFRWLAAISMDLGEDRIKPFLPEILQPLHRETVSSVSSDQELQKLAREVISLIKEIVGRETFAESYSKMQRKVTSKKETRKRQRLEEAIKDQEKFALKKIRRTAAKQEQKKRKMLKKRS
eukprot:gene3704-4224_t